MKSLQRIVPVALVLALGPGIRCQTPHEVRTLDGQEPHDLLGIAVAALGDVDGDSLPDYAVGACDGNGGTGEVLVVSGGSGAVLFRVAGTALEDRFGRSVAAAGDVNRDGTPDFLVGAPEHDGGGDKAGQAVVCSGRDGNVLFTFQGGAAGDEFGTAVAGIGDVNNDGYPDFAIGAPCVDSNGTDSGQVRLYSGRNGAVLRTRNGDSAHDWFGYAVAAAGDVNNDGRPDWIAGACYDDSSGLTNNGSARVYSGRNGAVLHTFRGAAASDWLGVAVAGAEDVDGDGHADVLVGAPLVDGPGGVNSGGATLYSGRTGGVLLQLFGERPGDEFGVALAGCGDFGGDTTPDVVVGAYRGSAGRPGAGSVYVFSGSNGNRLLTCHGLADDDRLGVAVAMIDDLTGDGRCDVLAGAVYADTLGTDAGALTLVGSQPATLRSSLSELSASTGDAQEFTLTAGPAFAGHTYRLVGSISGTTPGIRVGSLVLPLRYDNFTRFTIDSANTATLPGYFGTLDGSGEASARLVLPPLSSSAVGLTLYHAYFAYRNGVATMVSNYVALRIVP